MPFIEAAQSPMLAQRLIAGVPSITTSDADKIAKIICEWFMQDALPQLIVPAGIAVNIALAQTAAPGQVT
jgi:hypothetical protein